MLAARLGHHARLRARGLKGHAGAVILLCLLGAYPEPARSAWLFCLACVQIYHCAQLLTPSVICAVLASAQDVPSAVISERPYAIEPQEVAEIVGEQPSLLWVRVQRPSV